MRTSTLIVAAASAASVLGAPLEKRDDYAAPPGGDTTILNYALTLEYLERRFYQEGLANYTESDFCEFAGDEGSKFYKNLKTIYEDEKAHVTLIKQNLGTAAIAEPTFSFPVDTPESFIAFASVLEGVGVSAYLGGATAVASKDYLSAAGSIMAVEARHSAYLRAALGYKPFPKAFDTPLDFNQVHTIATQFIVDFAPGTPALPFKEFPKLEVTYVEGGGGCIFEGARVIALEAGNIKEDEEVYAVFFSGLESFYLAVTVSGDDYVLDEIPKGAVGQVYCVLSTANGEDVEVSDANTIAGVLVMEVSDASYH